MKAPEIHILVDSSLQKHLTQFSLPEDFIPVHEYVMLCHSAGEFMKQRDILVEVQNCASTQSERTMGYIRKQLETPWTSKSIEQWKELREQVLCQPAISQTETLYQKWSQIYIELPEANNSYCYSEANDYREIEIFFSEEQGKRKVREGTSCLPEIMRIQELQNLFS